MSIMFDPIEDAIAAIARGEIVVVADEHDVAAVAERSRNQ